MARRWGSKEKNATPQEHGFGAVEAVKDGHRHTDVRTHGRTQVTGLTRVHHETKKQANEHAEYSVLAATRLLARFSTLAGLAASAAAADAAAACLLACLVVPPSRSASTTTCHEAVWISPLAGPAPWVLSVCLPAGPLFLLWPVPGHPMGTSSSWPESVLLHHCLSHSPLSSLRRPFHALQLRVRPRPMGPRRGRVRITA